MTTNQNIWASRKHHIIIDRFGRRRCCVRPYTDDEFKELFQQSYDIVQRAYETPCWEWKFYRVQDGYGQVRYKGKDLGTHKLSWMLHKGEVPDGFKVCHHCDNPPCVNPGHLFVGTNKDNIDDANRKGRLARLAGSLNGWARMDEARVSAMRKEWVPYKMPAWKLAEKYGLSLTQTERILRHEAWAHVP